MTLSQALERAEAIHREICTAFAGTITITSVKTPILSAYASLALDHQYSMALLLRRDLAASAFVLARSIYEIVLRAGWTNACASESDLEKIGTGEFEFPPAGVMATAIDNAYGTESFFSGTHAVNWRTLNSLAHSGAHQLLNRFTGDQLTPSYTEDQKTGVLTSSLISTGLVVILALKSHGRFDEAAEIEAALLAFDQ